MYLPILVFSHASHTSVVKDSRTEIKIRGSEQLSSDSVLIFNQSSLDRGQNR